MINTVLLVLHLTGAAAWLGGHVVLLFVVAPAARRLGSAQPVIDFEHGFGRVGLVALGVQVVTGLLLARRYVGDWGTVLSAPTPAVRLLMVKAALLALIVALAGHSTHRLLPGLTYQRLGRFMVHAWIVTGLSFLLLVCGVGVRSGGLW